MPLFPGTRLGVYEVHSLLGAGGMGEVYRATDTRLKRQVALKVLPAAVASDPERLARFQREAEVLAALNHPNIAAIHGLEESGGTTALVMELVDGPTLADRLAAEPIPLDEALRIARQIAEALEAAHEQGIIHRDLKPANIKVRDDGTVKVLDFGLAKAMEVVGAARDISQSPTITTPAMSHAGIILGTAAYMSPEQARGKPTDKRTDVWSFGCVLYEMLTGRRAFDHEDVTDTLAAVVRAEPEWDALPRGIPDAIQALMRRCLAKDPRVRISDLAAARFALDLPDLAKREPPPPSQRTWQRRTIVAVALVTMIAIGLGLWASMVPTAPRRSAVRFVIPLPADQNLTGTASGSPLLAFSSDGEQLVYAANGRLYLRSMAAATAREIEGTDGAENPVFSPDGGSVAFFTRTLEPSVSLGGTGTAVIKRARLSGGAAITLCKATVPTGMSWGPDGLVFGEVGKGVMRVSPEGGEPEPLVRVNQDEIALAPQILPGGRAVLFTHVTGASDMLRRREEIFDPGWDQARIVVHSLSTGERKTVLQGGTDGRYAATGHIVYALGGTLRAVRFDVDRLEVTGAAAPLVEGVARTRFTLTVTGLAHFAISSTGALAYIAGPVSTDPPPRDFALYQPNGTREPLNLPPMLYEHPRVSPDERQLAMGAATSGNRNVWIYELSRKNPPRRLTFEGNNRFPIWSADGRAIAFQSDREGDLAIFTQPADGSRAAERLTRPAPDTAHVPHAWSPDGAFLLFSAETQSRFSLATLSARDKHVEAFADLDSSTTSPAATFSPDGSLIAYQSGDPIRSSVFVRPFPPTGAFFQVPSAARNPRWSADGKQLFVSGGPSIFGMPFNAQPTPTFGPRTQLIRNIPMGGAPRNYDVLAGGKQFVGIVVAEGQTPSTAAVIRQIDVVLNWDEELAARGSVK